MKQPGAYVVLFAFRQPTTIVVGRLGPVRFQPGCYAYVGSAMGGLAPRVTRHLKRHKRLRWHVDYALQKAGVIAVVTFPGSRRAECDLNDAIVRRTGSVQPVRGFGASDCRCHSHLHYWPGAPSGDSALDLLARVASSLP